MVTARDFGLSSVEMDVFSSLLRSVKAMLLAALETINPARDVVRERGRAFYRGLAERSRGCQIALAT